MDLDDDEAELERLCWFVCCPLCVVIRFTKPWYAIAWWHHTLESITAQQRDVQRDE